MDKPARRCGPPPWQTRPGTARSAAPPRPRPGNSRGSPSTRAGGFRPPPFLGDPLRAVGAHDPMPAPPPGEAERRVVGQQPERLDRLRRLEQPDRPRRFVEVPPRPDPLRPQGGERRSGPLRALRESEGPSRAQRRGWVRSCGTPHRGAFRDVALARLEPRQRGRAPAGCRAGRAAGRCRSSRS